MRVVTPMLLGTQDSRCLLVWQNCPFIEKCNSNILFCKYVSLNLIEIQTILFFQEGLQKDHLLCHDGWIYILTRTILSKALSIPSNSLDVAILGIFLFFFIRTGTFIPFCLLAYTEKVSPSPNWSYFLWTNINQTCHEHAASTARLFVTPVHGFPK